MFNFIDIYIFIPMSGWVGRDPSALLCPGPVMLLRWPCIYHRQIMERYFSMNWFIHWFMLNI